VPARESGEGRFLSLDHDNGHRYITKQRSSAGRKIEMPIVTVRADTLVLGFALWINLGVVAPQSSRPAIAVLGIEVWENNSR
jgi:hypothetical protein